MTREQLIIEALREENLTAQELADKFDISIAYVRNITDYLTTEGVVKKEKDKRSIIYTLNPDFQRTFPRFKVENNRGNKGFGDLTHLINFHNKDTQAINALRNLPLIASRILMAGYKYSTLYQTIPNDSPAFDKQSRPIKAELKLTRTELKSNISDIKRTLSILNELENNDDFWELNELKGYFDEQLNLQGQLLPKIDPSTMMEIYNQYISEVVK